MLARCPSGSDQWCRRASGRLGTCTPKRNSCSLGSRTPSQWAGSEKVVSERRKSASRRMKDLR